MHSFELKFDIYITSHRPRYNIRFVVHGNYKFLQDTQNFLYIMTYRLKILEVHLVLLNYIDLFKTDICYQFNYVCGHSSKFFA